MIKRMLIAAALTCLFTGVSSAQEIEIGAKAPDFKVKGIDDKEYTLESMKDSDVVVLAFTCNSCPVAVAYEDRFIEFAKKYKDKKVTFVAINCNNKTEDLEAMKERAEEKGFNFIYAFDETGKSAKDYGARVTPHLFVVKDGKVQYRGAFDNDMRKPSEHYVSTAVNSLLKGETPEKTSTRAVGCGIKMKK